MITLSPDPVEVGVSTWRDGPIEHFIAHGVPLIPQDNEGKPPHRWRDEGKEIPEAFTTDPARIDAYWKQGFRRFALVPQMSGLLVLDIDRKNQKDGLVALMEAMAFHKVALSFDIDAPPVYTASPSNGMHVYFKYSGKEHRPHDAIRKESGVEVKHAAALITAPGSLKERGGVFRPYLFIGSFEKIPTLPYALEILLRDPTREEPRKKRFLFSDEQRGKRSFQDIEAVLAKQGNSPTPGSRHAYCFDFAVFAKKEEHDKADTIEHLVGVMQGTGYSFSEIKSTVLSIYRGR